MRKFILLIGCLLLLCNCKKDVETSNNTQIVDTTTGTDKKTLVPVEQFDPKDKSVKTLGTVSFNNTPYTVVAAYTDNIIFKQKGLNIDGESGIVNYREQLVYLVNNKRDTITINKTLFKNQLPDYKAMVLQSTFLNHQLKAGIAPLIINFCMPDSDYCYHFDVRLDSFGTILLNEIDEDDFWTEGE